MFLGSFRGVGGDGPAKGPSSLHIGACWQAATYQYFGNEMTKAGQQGHLHESSHRRGRDNRERMSVGLEGARQELSLIFAVGVPGLRATLLL